MSFAGAIEAGKAFVSFGVDTKKFEMGLKKIQGRMRGFGVAMQAQSASIATSLAFSVVPFVGAIKVFSELEEKLTFVAAAANKTLREMPKLVSVVRELGRTTSFTASEVADAALAMSRAGVAARDIPKALKSVVAFSKATQLEMGRAAEVVVDTLNAFGRPFSEAAEAVDIMTRTANSSSQTMEQLAEALSYAAPQASSLGMSLQDTTAFLGLLANSSIKASIAGTGLQRILINMGKSAQQAKFDEMGIETVDQATGKMRNLADIIADLNKEAKMKNLSALEKSGLFNDLFGRGSKAALILARQIGDTAASFDDFKSKIEGAKSATEIQAELMNTAAGRMQLMRSAVLEAAESIGSAFTSAISGLVGPVAKLTKDISALFKANNKLGSIITKTVIAIGAGTAAMFSLGIALKVAAVAMSPLVGAMGALSAISALLNANLIAQVSIVSATKAVFFGLLTVMKTITLALFTVNGLVALGTAAMTAWNVVAGTTMIINQALAATFAALAAFLGGGIFGPVVIAMVAIGAAVFVVVAAFKAWGKFMPKLKGFFDDVVGGVKNSINELISIWSGFFGRVFTSGKNIAIAFKTGDLRLIFDKIWNELKFVLMDFVVSLTESMGQMSPEEAAEYRAGLEADRAIGDQKAGDAAELRNARGRLGDLKEAVIAELNDVKDQVHNDTDITADEKAALKEAANELRASAKGMRADFDPKDRVAAARAEQKAVTLQQKRDKLAAAQDAIAARRAQEKAEVEADLAGTGSELTPEGIAAKREALAAGEDKLAGLELRRKKNQLALDKRRAGNIESFQSSLGGPSSSDIRSASGFNKLLTAQNNPVVQSVEGLRIQLQEDALKQQELLLEQNNIQKDIAKQNKEVEALAGDLNP